MGAKLKISIVTPSFNSGRFIGEAIESVRAQSGDVGEVEQIIADAESTDDTAAVLARYPELRIDRRPDAGIYDGINRAVSLATGDIIGILNSDDALAPGSLLHVRERFEAEPTDVLTGAFQVMDVGGVKLPSEYIPQSTPSVTGLLFGIPAINARFFNRDAFRKAGPFDLTFPLAADRVWLVQACRAGLNFRHTARNLYYYRKHDSSRTLAGDYRTRTRVWREHVSVAQALLANSGSDQQLARALQSWQALELTKLLIAGEPAMSEGSSRRGRFSAARDLRRLGIRAPVALATGIANWLRFRGRHSDILG